MEYKEWLEKERLMKAEETRRQELELLEELKEKYEPVGDRFMDNGNGTITDNLTKLVWLKDANAFSGRTWEQALAFADTLSSGSHGLTDGSNWGDWRLPNVKELHSLIDYVHYDPALPEGNPFVGVQSSYYWSSTPDADDSSGAWSVGMGSGRVSFDYKTSRRYVWPVRTG